MTDRPLPPVKGEGSRDGFTPRDIPDGYITWEEHYQAWVGYRANFPDGRSAEDVANFGGFTYTELKLYLGYNPVSWVPRDMVRYGGWARGVEDIPGDEAAEEVKSRLRSHIRYTGDGEPICKNPVSAPDRPFNFDDEEAVYCSPCLRKIHNWVAGWITSTPTDRAEV